MKVTWPTSSDTSTKRVFVGLSGGVDSALSAALLREAGYDVTGVFIRIAIPGYPCTAGEDKREAMRVAAHLKIPFLSVDLSKDYQDRVFAHALQEFRKGRTPNPDALCNKEIKFGLFFEWCVAQGADLVATGHYAQVRDGLLYMGADTQKDQSYFLWAVPQERLLRTLFPIGHLQKQEVREQAKARGLPNAERPDSQGLCFLGPISLDDMLSQELSPKRGAVRSVSGEVVGEHEGVERYTLGQRHGFTLTKKTPDEPAYFVVAKNLAENTITISPDRYPRSASRTIVALADENWIGPKPAGACEARYRYRQPLMSARYDSAAVTLMEPQYVPEGQSLVMYDGTRCLGGGVVDKSSLE